MTQVDPLSTIIFNVVVDAVVRHWMAVMVEGMEEQGEGVQEVRHHNTLFYTDDGTVALSDPRWLQGAFSTLVGMFDRMGLRNNVWKTVGMVCRPFQEAGTHSGVAYGRRMTVEGPSFKGWQKGRVQCRECREDMPARSMAGHMKIQYGQVAEERWSWLTSATGE